MSKICEFLKECGPFFVLTVNEDAPAGRPFGAVMEYDNDLYISTADGKAVYKQLKSNEKMQIVALKPGTREWVRINGIAKECISIDIKRMMLKECPVLTNHYSSPEDPHYCVFLIKVVDWHLF